jgi:hypothetical protein
MLNGIEAHLCSLAQRILQLGHHNSGCAHMQENCVHLIENCVHLIENCVHLIERGAASQPIPRVSASSSALMHLTRDKRTRSLIDKIGYRK